MLAVDLAPDVCTTKANRSCGLFSGIFHAQISGTCRPWRLYYEKEDEAGVKPPRCDAAWPGDLYLTEHIKEIASTYYPSIGIYDVADPLVAEYHVLLAKAAGIDGFMAEFTIGQEAKLLSLVEAACKHNFQVGVNWISQSHLGENTWPDRETAINKAKEVVRWLAENVYRRCGAMMNGKPLLMIFLCIRVNPPSRLIHFFRPKKWRC